MRVNTTQEYDPERPIPYIVDLSVQGMLLIGWDRKMRLPDNFVEIPLTKIAVEEAFNVEEYRFFENRGGKDARAPTVLNDGRRRELQGRDYYQNLELKPNQPEIVYFAETDKSFYEKMKLIDALELLITPANSLDESEMKKVEFTWEIKAFSQDYIWIQLEFVNPWDIANDSQFDTLSVTFWGVEYFKSSQNKEVKFGTTLYWPIFRQVSSSELETVDSLNSILDILWFGTMLLILPVITAGSLLPTWMFINSLQIIAHMVLLKTLMPGTVHHFLDKYL